MLKKLLSALCFLILSFICTTLISNLQMMLPQTEIAVWSQQRVLFSSLAFAFWLSILIQIVISHKVLKPYLIKLYSYRFLLFQLIRRDFKAKYKRSFLGVFWTVLNPILNMLVLTIVFSSIFRFEIPNYSVYLLSGQIIFMLFSEATNSAMTSILAGGGEMIKKVNIPKYIFPLSKVLSSLVNFVFSLLALFFIILITRAPIYPTMLLIFVPLIYLFFFATGIGLILSVVAVVFRDMVYLYGIGLSIVMYLTPIFYPISIIPERYRILVSLNPLARFVELFRSAVVYGVAPGLWEHIVCGTLAAAVFILGLFLFYKKQDELILYI